MSWNFIWSVLFLSLFSYSFAQSLENSGSDSLDASLQDFAFKTLVLRRPHTGALYKAILPSNLSSIEVSIVRLRSRRLWNKGANFSFFHIPSRTLPVPHVRRLAIVYQNLGNWSSHYYGIKGYSLITPVVGFMVFDASNVSAKSITKLSLNTTGKPVSIRFPSLAFPEVMISRRRCVAFSGNGTVYLSEMRLSHVCYSREQGHFSVVVPLDRKQQRLWYLWVVGFVLGIAGMVLMIYAGMVSIRFLKSKKIQVMERQADEDTILESRWVGSSSKMPSAAVTRTQPVLENGVVP